MKSKWLLGIFAAIALAQLIVVASTVWRQERTLAVGRVFKFHTQRIDPYDAFRGRYVALSFNFWVPASAGGSTAYILPTLSITKVYCVIEEDSNGFANVSEVMASPPKGKPYLKCRAIARLPGSDRVNIQPPFDRFYLEETKAPEAEKAYRKYAGKQDSYLVVRILDGNWAVEDLYVGGKPIREVLQELKP